jgi:hypothetical protein
MAGGGRKAPKEQASSPDGIRFLEFSVEVQTKMDTPGSTQHKDSCHWTTHHVVARYVLTQCAGCMSHLIFDLITLHRGISYLVPVHRPTQQYSTLSHHEPQRQPVAVARLLGQRKCEA